MESTDQSSTAIQPEHHNALGFAAQSPKWLDETDEHKYARHTRNATVFIAWLLGISAVAGIVLGIIAVVDLSKTANAVNPTQSATCFLPPC